MTLLLISGATIDIQDDGINVGLGTILNFGSGLSVIGPGLQEQLELEQ
jgi:hypothetical protein